jgi:6-phosphofructokinase 1
MFGVRHGYHGLITGEIIPLGARDVGGIIQQGGTMLGSARSKEFRTEEGRKTALKNLEAKGIDALVVIGGNGSQTGANALNEMGLPTVGVASTIDNDLTGSEITIGVDTALNIALEAIDRLKVTASSHQRAFLVEVMGRDCGYLALMAAIAGGAETVVIPEVKCDMKSVANSIRAAYDRGKAHALIVVAEGAEFNAEEISTHCAANREEVGFDLRVTTLGHVQRGGTPTASDRILAARLGVGAIDLLASGDSGKLTGIMHGEICYTPLKTVVSEKKELDPKMLEMATVLAM